jgi:hypothetical protein
MRYRTRPAIFPVPCVTGPLELPRLASEGSGMAPLRWRPPLGDQDIRDIKPPAPGTEIDMPDLPAFLDRRPVVLKAAA